MNPSEGPNNINFGWQNEMSLHRPLWSGNLLMSRSFTLLMLEAEFVSYVRNRIRLRPGVLTFDRIKAKMRNSSG